MKQPNPLLIPEDTYLLKKLGTTIDGIQHPDVFIKVFFWCNRNNLYKKATQNDYEIAIHNGKFKSIKREVILCNACRKTMNLFQYKLSKEEVELLEAEKK